MRTPFLRSSRELKFTSKEAKRAMPGCLGGCDIAIRFDVAKLTTKY
jgi:hypothetical protein